MGFASSSEARVNKWFSRRYQSGEVHSNVSQVNQDRLAEKSYRAWDRMVVAEARTLQEKLARLPEGGAKRERAKLARKIAALKQHQPCVVSKPRQEPKQKGWKNTK